MVARAVGYCVEPFGGERGVTQGGPRFPKIFNVVVKSVVRHWGSLVAEGVGEYIRDNRSGNEADQPAIQMIRACDNGKR